MRENLSLNGRQHTIKTSKELGLPDLTPDREGLAPLPTEPYKRVYSDPVDVRAAIYEKSFSAIVAESKNVTISTQPSLMDHMDDFFRDLERDLGAYQYLTTPVYDSVGKRLQSRLEALGPVRTKPKDKEAPVPTQLPVKSALEKAS